MIVHNIIPLNFDEKLRKTKKNEEKRRKTKKNEEKKKKELIKIVGNSE